MLLTWSLSVGIIATVQNGLLDGLTGRGEGRLFWLELSSLHVDQIMKKELA